MAVNKGGRKLTYSLPYSDVAPQFRAPLGFVPRTDIRQVLSFASLRWGPRTGAINAIGPNSFVQYTWNQRGELTDYLVRLPLQIDFKRQTGLSLRRAEAMERERQPSELFSA